MKVIDYEAAILSIDPIHNPIVNLIIYLTLEIALSGSKTVAVSPN